MRLSRLVVCVAVFLLISGSAWATTWNVATTGCSDVTCTPCCTIQAAVERSSDGDTISVAPGTYPEELDLRDMVSPGGLTLEAGSGPGTVMVSPPLGEGIFAGSSNSGTVTIDGIDFTTTDSSCVWLAHPGDAVVRDVTADNCGYSAFNIDSSGEATLDRITVNNSARTGIQVDGASTATLTDCTANSNDEHGIYVLNVPGAVEITNPTTIGNTDEGVYGNTIGPLTLNNATITDNDGRGVRIHTASSVIITGSTVTGSLEQGVDIDWIGADPVDSVTLTGTEVDNNGHGGDGESGARLRNVDGPVVVTNCSFNNNGFDGFSPEDSVIGDLEIYGGEANGNADEGYDLRVTGNATVIGATANGNFDTGFATDMPGTLFFQDCVANDNTDGSGFDLQWQDPDFIDGASVINCTANNNGLAGGGNGIRVKHVWGPVTVVGARANGNYWTGVRVDDTNGTVLIRDAVASFGLEDGIKVDADYGPVTVVDSVAESNATEGLIINGENVDVETITVKRNSFVSNSGTGVALLGLGGSGPFNLKCNDIAGNTDGMYLANTLTVDARHIWWGDPTGPSNQGPGAGDTIYAEPGGTILHDPWLVDSFTAPVSGCPMFESDFESGLAEEWDLVVGLGRAAGRDHR